MLLGHLRRAQSERVFDLANDDSVSDGLLFNACGRRVGAGGVRARRVVVLEAVGCMVLGHLRRAQSERVFDLANDDSVSDGLLFNAYIPSDDALRVGDAERDEADGRPGH